MLHNVASKTTLTSHVSGMSECAPGIQNLLARGWIIGDADNAQLTVIGLAALNTHLTIANNLARYTIMPDGRTVITCHIKYDDFCRGERRHGMLPDGATFPV